MTLVDELRKRKAALELELQAVNNLLSVHPLSMSDVDSGMTIQEACENNIISGRLSNLITGELFGDTRLKKTITLAQTREKAEAMSYAEILKKPNFGRKSLNELIFLIKRMT